MGSGASTEKDTLKPLLLSQELVDGSAALVADFPFRVSFTNYIKSGIWLDRLSWLVPESQLVSIGVAGALRAGVAVEQDTSVALKASSKSDMSPKPPLYNSSKSTAVNEYAELSSGDAGSFPPEELLVILFTILYPIYLSSQEYERFLKYGIEQGNSVQDDNSSRSVASLNPQGTNMVQTNSSKRAQELLLSCAAHYDEFFLQEFLQAANWLQRVCSIFRDHTLALCITDTAKDGLPMLFANKAFCRLTGFAESELTGKDFAMLCGPDTEMSQLNLMHSSIRSTETVKFSITLQSKAKKPLLDFVAQKAVGAYSVSAHFVPTKLTQPESVHAADDVLLFLSYLVKAPALPVKPSWMPTPIAILAQAASSVLQSASPSSARSRSSSIRHGHAGKKGGKGGTPTSVRSFNSGRRAGSDGGSGPNSYRRPVREAESNSEPRSVRSSGVSVGDTGKLVSVVPEGAVEAVLEDVEQPHK